MNLRGNPMKKVLESVPMTQAPVRIQRFEDHYSHRRIHWHEEIELLYFTEGTAVTACNLQEYRVKKGDLLVVNGRELHTGNLSLSHSVFYCIQLHSGFFQNTLGTDHVIFHSLIQDPHCVELLDQILLHWHRGGYRDEIALRRITYQLLEYLALSHASVAQEGKKEQMRYQKSDTFYSIVKYLEQTYEADHRIEDLAAHFFMSPSYFSHLFKSLSGKSVMTYLTELRISRAKLLLEQEDCPVSEVATKVGYNDGNYFARIFKSTTGQTPSQYRNACRRQKNIECSSLS